jgi:hypothetical protein
MEYRECACGCGKVFEVPRKDKIYYNRVCKQRASLNRKNGKKVTPPKSKNWQNLKAKTRWKAMTLSEVEAECLRLHLSYGQVQVMAQNNTLPKDFGKEVRE